MIAALGDARLRFPHQLFQILLGQPQVLPGHDRLVVSLEPSGQGGHVRRVELPRRHPQRAPGTSVGARPAPLGDLQPLAELLLAIYQEVHARQEAGDDVVGLRADVAHHRIPR